MNKLIIINECSHVAIDRNPAPGYNTLLLRLSSPHRQFHTLPGLLESRAALSYPMHACLCKEAVCTIFMMVFVMTRLEREPMTLEFESRGRPLNVGKLMHKHYLFNCSSIGTCHIIHKYSNCFYFQYDMSYNFIKQGCKDMYNNKNTLE